MSRVAVFPGSFDPITNAHLDVIRRAAGIIAPGFRATARAALVIRSRRPASRRGYERRFLASRASATGLGTMPEMSPPNLATSLLSDEEI